MSGRTGRDFFLTQASNRHAHHTILEDSNIEVLVSTAIAALGVRSVRELKWQELPTEGERAFVVEPSVLDSFGTQRWPTAREVRGILVQTANTRA